ncbi:MAG: hypothetical protein ACKOFW_05090, partial [Planctomycetaceae bacterium]
MTADPMVFPQGHSRRISFWRLVLWGCLLSGGALQWCDQRGAARLRANDESPPPAGTASEAAAPSDEDVQFFEARVRP